MEDINEVLNTIVDLQKKLEEGKSNFETITNNFSNPEDTQRFHSDLIKIKNDFRTIHNEIIKKQNIFERRGNEYGTNNNITSNTRRRNE